jgi:hypothetical protein
MRILSSLEYYILIHTVVLYILYCNLSDFRTMYSVHSIYKINTIVTFKAITYTAILMYSGLEIISYYIYYYVVD